jgi:hypothetical protein
MGADAAGTGPLCFDAATESEGCTIKTMLLPSVLTV